MEDILTSSEAARLCGVSFRTVIRWIERGQLQAYKLRGRGDHRVPVVELRRFMRANGIPEPAELQREMSRRILIAEDEPNMVQAMSRTLKLAGFETTSARGWAVRSMEAMSRKDVGFDFYSNTR